MTLPDPYTIDTTGGDIAALLGLLPDSPAVFLLWPPEGSAPYLGRTTVLRRRLMRMLAGERKASMWLRLSGLIARVDYWLVRSSLASSLVHYTLARRHFPEAYLKLAKLRMPPYLRVILSNEFPRTQVTTRLGGPGSLYYGPFRTRAAAEQFEGQFLDLFQVRRCQEDLVPSPMHPGCMYGEMNMCLRPCQQAVTAEEYASEVKRASDFLVTEGRSLVQILASARDRASQEMDFEEAGRLHRRIEKVDQVRNLRDDLAGDAAESRGIAVTRSTVQGAVELRPLWSGCWQPPILFQVEQADGKPVSLERRLREHLDLTKPEHCATSERQEHLALLSRWYYSSWRDGEWLTFQNIESLPWRRLAGAIHRVASPTS